LIKQISLLPFEHDHCITAKSFLLGAGAFDCGLLPEILNNEKASSE
jgi:hypothetical protein